MSSTPDRGTISEQQVLDMIKGIDPKEARQRLIDLGGTFINTPWGEVDIQPGETKEFAWKRAERVYKMMRGDFSGLSTDYSLLPGEEAA